MRWFWLGIFWAWGAGAQGAYEMAQVRQEAFLYGLPALSSGPVAKETLKAGAWVRLLYMGEGQRWAYVQAYEGHLGWIPTGWLRERRHYDLAEVERSPGRVAVFYPRSKSPHTAPEQIREAPPPWADTQLRELLRSSSAQGQGGP